MEAVVNTSYNMDLVVLSYVISVVGAFIALYSAGRLKPHSNNRQAYLFSVTSAGVALGGIGVWSMHFIAMLAYDPGVVVGYEVLTPPVGRNVAETLRQIQAFQLVRASKGTQATPSGWRPGKKVLTPGPDMVGKVWEVWKVSEAFD